MLNNISVLFTLFNLKTIKPAALSASEKLPSPFLYKSYLTLIKVVHITIGKAAA